MVNKLIALRAVTLSAVLTAPLCVWSQEYISGMKWNEPVVVTPGKTDADPPSDAIILFDGKDLSAWENGDNWTVKDGIATVGKGDIKTKQSFGDCQLHIEWSAPSPPHGHSQGRGNSGVFLQDRYELQVLDSYKDETYFDGQASAIYKQHPPMVNAMRPPGEWNTYDVIWTAPQFKDDGSLKSPANITVLHNGVLTQNHFVLAGNTLFTEVPHYEKHGKLPIHLQDHGNPVRYRNIWVREIKPIEGTREREPYFHNHDTGKDTPVEKKTSSIQSGSSLDIDNLASTSTVNLGIGTPRFTGQGSGQLQRSMSLVGPGGSQFQETKDNFNGPAGDLPKIPLTYQTIQTSGGILTFGSPSPKDMKALQSR